MLIFKYVVCTHWDHRDCLMTIIFKTSKFVLLLLWGIQASYAATTLQLINNTPYTLMMETPTSEVVVDSVTETNTSVVMDQPESAMGTLYQATSENVGKKQHKKVDIHFAMVEGEKKLMNKTYTQSCDVSTSRSSLVSLRNGKTVKVEFSCDVAKDTMRYVFSLVP